MRDTLFPDQRLEALTRVSAYVPLEYAVYRPLEGTRVDRKVVASEVRAIHGTGITYRDSEPRERSLAGARRSVSLTEDHVAEIHVILAPQDRVIPLEISTGYGRAVLVRAGCNEGFEDAPSIDFDQGKVVGLERDRKYFEQRGFIFTSF